MYSTQSSVTMQTVNAVQTFVDWCCFAVRLVIKSYALVFEAFLMSSASVTFVLAVGELLVTRDALVTRSDFTQTQPPRHFTHVTTDVYHVTGNNYVNHVAELQQLRLSSSIMVHLHYQHFSTTTNR